MFSQSKTVNSCIATPMSYWLTENACYRTERSLVSESQCARNILLLVLQNRSSSAVISTACSLHLFCQVRSLPCSQMLIKQMEEWQWEEPRGDSSNRKRNNYRSIQHSLFTIQISALFCASALFGMKCATAKGMFGLKIEEPGVQFPFWAMVGWTCFIQQSTLLCHNVFCHKPLINLVKVILLFVKQLECDLQVQVLVFMVDFILIKDHYACVLVCVHKWKDKNNEWN